MSTFDSRSVGVETVEAWWPILADVDVQEAVTVVRNHFATTTDYLMPAHILGGVKRLSGPRRLVSDRSMFCIHHYPVAECERGCR